MSKKHPRRPISVGGRDFTWQVVADGVIIRTLPAEGGNHFMACATREGAAITPGLVADFILTSILGLPPRPRAVPPVARVAPRPRQPIPASASQPEAYGLVGSYYHQVEGVVSERTLAIHLDPVVARTEADRLATALERNLWFVTSDRGKQDGQEASRHVEFFRSLNVLDPVSQDWIRGCRAERIHLRVDRYPLFGSRMA